MASRPAAKIRELLFPKLTLVPAAASAMTGLSTADPAGDGIGGDAGREGDTVRAPAAVGPTSGGAEVVEGEGPGSESGGATLKGGASAATGEEEENGGCRDERAGLR